MYYQPPPNDPQPGLWEKLKRAFRQGSALTRLLYINLAVFAICIVIEFLLRFFGFHASDTAITIRSVLGFPVSPAQVVTRPWTVVTYMFTHLNLMHILFNILWLYWFGTIFLQHFSGRKLTGVYLLGGVTGLLFYVICYWLMPSWMLSWGNQPLIGASASIMAIVFAICTWLPNHRITIFLIGPVKLIYLALFTIAIDLLSLSSGNTSGHLAHLGGALFGWIFTLEMKKNNDITAWLMNILEKMETRLFHPRKMKVKYKKTAAQMSDREYNEYKKQRENRINEILDKISRSGYDSLTREEKEILFKSTK